MSIVDDELGVEWEEPSYSFSITQWLEDARVDFKVEVDLHDHGVTISLKKHGEEERGLYLPATGTKALARFLEFALSVPLVVSQESE